jgi:hypothetical protein
MDRKFDLVVSLEVAEHLPGEHAETYVDSLTRLGPAVLFSAAVPYQGGTEHVNEQWPDYWVELFERKGFVVLDPIRKRIWQHPGVEYWYSQNILLFVKRDYLENRPELEAERKDARISQLSLIHPRMFLELGEKYSETFHDYEIFSAEAEKYREEAAMHREKAEHYIAEAEAHRAKAEYYYAEAERYRAKADPRNMSFKEVVKALPAIIAGAFRRDVEKRSIR